MTDHWKKIIDLRTDSAPLEEIQRRIESDANIEGSTLIILMMAIFIASVGLNMNSTAVIIGAMLISPLMAGIVAIGYGMASYNWHFIQQSAIKLFFQVGVALFTSALYFSLTPITSASSEILARTTPTFWDVIIALCGGIAGAVGNTRKEKSNVIPGVAIATALMPPLCTAGYGLAQHSWSYFWGAFYLFFINGFFIALASFIIFKLMRIPAALEVNSSHLAVQRWALIVLGIGITVPSICMAYRSVDANLAESQIKSFIAQEVDLPASSVVSYKLTNKELTLDVVGQPLTESQKLSLQDKMSAYSQLKGRNLRVVQGSVSQSLSTEQVQAIIDSRMKLSAKQDDTSYKTLAAQYYPAFEQREADKKLVENLADELPTLFHQILAVQGGTLVSPLQTAGETEPVTDDLGVKSDASGDTVEHSTAPERSVSDSKSERPDSSVASNAEKTATDDNGGIVQFDETFMVRLVLNSKLTHRDELRLQEWLEKRTGRRVLIHFTYVHSDPSQTQTKVGN